MHKKRALVVFGDSKVISIQGFDEVISGDELIQFLEPGSIYEATTLLKELSLLTLPNGTRVSKSLVYKGYELWWFRYNNLFLQNCLPYTQYKKLLIHLKSFDEVYLENPPYPSLFSSFFEAHGVRFKFFGLSRLPFGVIVQIFLTLIFLPVLILKRRQLLVFTGDKFEKNRDHDFRLRYIYEELRENKIRFVEVIRSLESWKTVLAHAWTRRRAVVYSEAVIFLGRMLSVLSGGRAKGEKGFGAGNYSNFPPAERFKFFLATQYLKTAYDDIWAVRLMGVILKILGIKAAYITTVLERNFHTFLACKINNLPTVGILHGVASHYYNGYDFLPAYDGQKSMNVDKYGLWSEWWKEYYLKEGRSFKEDQLYVSGLMRPFDKAYHQQQAPDDQQPGANKTGQTKVLFVSEQLAVPSEVIPYLEALLREPDIEIIFTFRPYRDGFQDWLRKNRPEIFENQKIRIAENGLQAAIAESDVAVGTMSTAVIEALFQLKVPILFYTKKWGDYFNLEKYDEDATFFAANPSELVIKTKKAQSISTNVRKGLLKRYFGDPYANGSKWVVEELSKHL